MPLGRTARRTLRDAAGFTRVIRGDAVLIRGGIVPPPAGFGDVYPGSEPVYPAEPVRVEETAPGSLSLKEVERQTVERS